MIPIELRNSANLCISYKIVHNGGLLMNPQKRVTISLGNKPSDKGFSCIDFHPDGK